MDNQNPLKQTANNPLYQFYRKPGTYISLPSGGRFYKKSPKLTDSNELAVYPMTARDELILKNPDALYNGEAVRQVLTSILPDIADVNEMPAADVDMALVAMRMASYGDDLSLDVSHNCKESQGKSQRITVGLGSIVSSMRPIDPNIGKVLLSSGLEVHIRPYNLQDQGRLLKAQFNSMRSMQAMEANKNLTVEEKTAAATREYDTIVLLSQEILFGCVEKVVMPDGKEVADRKYINEWLKNLDRASVKRLEDEIKKFQEFGIIREVDVKCEHCGEHYKSDMLFDPTSFFTEGS